MTNIAYNVENKLNKNLFPSVKFYIFYLKDLFYMNINFLCSLWQKGSTSKKEQKIKILEFASCLYELCNILKAFLTSYLSKEGVE